MILRATGLVERGRVAPVLGIVGHERSCVSSIAHKEIALEDSNKGARVTVDPHIGQHVVQNRGTA